jgi:4-hydroxy-2-oxoheptanedioate aldolase
MQAIGHIAARARAAGKHAGIYVVDPALVGRYVDMGYRLIALGGESRYMALGAASLLEKARASIS